MVLLKRYKNGEKNVATDEQLWKAQKVTQAILHPDTGEKILPPFRMSGYVPFGWITVLKSEPLRHFNENQLGDWYVLAQPFLAHVAILAVDQPISQRTRQLRKSKCDTGFLKAWKEF